jgi:hypothetical protein
VLSTTEIEETTEAKHENNGTTRIIEIQQSENKRKHETSAILQAQLLAHQQAYLSQPVYLKKN